MKMKLGTILGSFTVINSCKPGDGDETLANLAMCIDNAALPFLQKGNSPEEILTLLDEGDLEAKLYKSVTAGGGAGKRLQLDLKKKQIEFSNF